EDAARRAELLLAAWPQHPAKDDLVALRARSLLEDGRRDDALALAGATRHGDWLRAHDPSKAPETHVHGSCR
ncbi:MAG TPA: hypothetical protein VMZ28_00040, partial [Kofleriaceae bacterium]|nr:hypothetical protein [Kofleriaceae bacterium]